MAVATRSPLLAGLVVLLACTDAGDTTPETADTAPDPARCEAEVVALTDGVQRYLDALADLPPQEYATSAGARATVELNEVTEDRVDELVAEGCEAATVRRELASGLARLAARGPTASAVAEQLREGLLGAERVGARTIEVAVEDDLAVLAATAPAGSTLALDEGEHQVDEPVVVGHSLAIVGSGPERTRIVSSAEDVAVLVTESGALDLRGVTLTHAAEWSSAVLLINSPWYRVTDARITGGTRSDRDGGGIGLLVQPTLVGPRGEAPPAIEGSDATWDGAVTATELADNDGGGVVVLGHAEPRVSGSVLRGNGVCGACYLGGRGGSLTDSEAIANEVGVVVSATARPMLTGNLLADNTGNGLVVDDRAAGTYHGNEVVDNEGQGVVVTDDATPLLTSNHVEGHGEVAIAVGGRSQVTLEGNRVAGHEIGVWAEDEASVSTEGNELTGPGTVAVAFTLDSHGSLHGDEIAGYALGVEARDRAEVGLDAVVVSGTEEAAIVLRDEATAQGGDNRCDDNPFDIVLFDASTHELGGDGCELHDER